MNYNHFMRKLQYSVRNRIENIIVRVSIHNGRIWLNVSYDGIVGRLIKIDGLWRIYRETGDLNKCVDAVQAVISKSDFNDINRDLPKFKDYEAVKNLLVPDILPADANENDQSKSGLYLKLCDDLYAAPVIPANDDTEWIISDKLQEWWDISSEKLWTDMMDRMQREHPAYIMDIENYAALRNDRKGWKGILPEAKVATCGAYIWGTSAFLYPDVRKELEKTFGGDFLVVFTSGSEFVAAPLHTMEKAVRLADYCADFHRQNGEDLIIEKVYRMRTDTGIMEWAN